MLRGKNDDMRMDIDDDKPQIFGTKVRGVNRSGTGQPGSGALPPNSWIPGNNYGSSGNGDNDDDDDDDSDPYADVTFASVAGLDEQITYEGC